MTPGPATTFRPSPEETDRLLTLYLDPSRSLSDLAQEAAATLPALTRWLALPGTAAQLEALEQAAARRTRAVAGQHLPAAVPVLTAILGEHRRAQASGTLPSDPGLRRRAHETARRAAALLVRLARFNPAPARTTSAAREHPAPAATADARPTATARAPRPAPAIDPATLTRLLTAAAAAAEEDPTPPDAARDPAASSRHETTHNTVDGPAPHADEDAAADPDALAILERLAEIPEDCPDDELGARIAAILSTPHHPPLREAG